MLDVLMQIAGKTITAQWWVYAGVILAVAWIAWLVGRGGLKDERQLRRHVEDDARVGGFAIGRAEVQAARLDAVTQALTPMELPPREGFVPAPDRPAVLQAEPLLTVAPTSVDLVVYEPQPEPQQPDGFDEMLEAAKAFEAESLAAIRDPQSAPEPRLDLADLHDVEPDEDEPGGDGEPPADGDGPAEPPGMPMVTMLSPRPTRVWPAASDWSPDRGVLPVGWMTRIRWRLRTWWVRVRREAAILHQMEARGFAPGEATELVRSGPPMPPLPGSKAARRRHLARRGAESWADRRSALSARWYAERQEAADSLQRLLQPRSESGWSLVLPEMRAALAPQRRTVPSPPFSRCVP